ncbi:hypothetical protein H6G97_13465 [Nostoc flagelliforme FACHB-838]|uniref:Uncharacterized protein n=1 Tax=Nostoc flagelliforme FACHB-838 TaxID=2692904 RepID=A0ABR8DNN5_9NOSO|nr:hypothetical protein [Nostoc flagelliforme]MBD2530525.1 hypothetical protein [Nostoc flagelliforme FACHB-838]
MIERLERIEPILEWTAQRAEENKDTMFGNKPLCVYAQLYSTVNFLVQLPNFEAILTEQKEIEAEIRELRTENQSILEHLFARQENGE